VVAADEIGLRLALFEWLADERERSGEVFSRDRLAAGVSLLGRHVHVIGPQGIFKPVGFSVPLSITTSPNSRYSDRFESDTLLRYAYRGSDPGHPDNVGLVRAMTERVPLVYFHGIEPNAYVAVAPVFVVGADPVRLFFHVQADDMSAFVRDVASPARSRVADDAAPRREYVTATVKRRLHQVAFRERVLRAYRERCALCRLGHRALLDAAHITPDADPMGEPLVSNGLALCKLHHAAFDQFFFGVTPDYRIDVRRSILEEADGPMLVVGLQQIHGQLIELPRQVAQRPDPERLRLRYQAFDRAS
jgi:putative restriction endonuclease